jgi:hypothetical protein
MDAKDEIIRRPIGDYQPVRKQELESDREIEDERNIRKYSRHPDCDSQISYVFRDAFMR